MTKEAFPIISYNLQLKLKLAPIALDFRPQSLVLDLSGDMVTGIGKEQMK